MVTVLQATRHFIPGGWAIVPGSLLVQAAWVSIPPRCELSPARMASHMAEERQPPNATTGHPQDEEDGHMGRLSGPSINFYGIFLVHRI